MATNDPKVTLPQVNSTGDSGKKKRRSAKEWKPVFLAALRTAGNVRFACEVAGISRKAAYQWRERSAKFAGEWDDAMDEAIDMLEAQAYKRALTSSDTLLMFLLKAHRPKRYRETVRQEHSGRVSQEIEAKVDDDTARRIADYIAAGLKSSGGAGPAGVGDLLSPHSR